MLLAPVPRQTPDAELPKQMLVTAKAFVTGLTDDERKKALFGFEDEERLNWHFVPKERNGLSLAMMSPATTERATALLKASLSTMGYKKIEAIRSLEPVLKEMENGNPGRDLMRYFVTVFGEPTSKGTWGLRYEGHHLSLQWTMSEGKLLASTPQFMGTNPAEVRQGALKGTRVLGEEEDLGRALVKSLTSEQQKVAVVDAVAPSDIITGANRKAAIEGRRGLKFGAMTKAQQGLMLSLIQEYASVQVSAVAKGRLDKVRKGDLDSVVFAWMGGIEKGQPHYYRVQGSNFLIEYDNTQNNANHIHAVWRDLDGDFGGDLLGKHYSEKGSHHRH